MNINNYESNENTLIKEDDKSQNSDEKNLLMNMKKKLRKQIYLLKIKISRNWMQKIKVNSIIILLYVLLQY